MYEKAIKMAAQRYITRRTIMKSRVTKYLSEFKAAMKDASETHKNAKTVSASNMPDLVELFSLSEDDLKKMGFKDENRNAINRDLYGLLEGVGVIEMERTNTFTLKSFKVRNKKEWDFNI